MHKIRLNGTVISDSSEWIYQWLGIPYISANYVKKELEAANGEEVEITINSGGGDVYVASEIREMIRAYDGTIKIKLVGMAASAASVIATAAYCEIAPTAVFMIHNASTSAYGDYRDMQKSKDFLIKVNKSIVNSYIEKTGKSTEELFRMMDAETWLTAKEAVANGFVDAVSESKQQNKVVELSAYNDAFGQIPEDVINKLKNLLSEKKVPVDKPEVPFNIKENKEKKEEQIMDLEEFLKQNPEAAKELEQKIEAAFKEGEEKERKRIQDIDKISHAMPKDMVEAAKYEKPVAAETLALEFVTQMREMESKYMKDVLEDNKKSNVQNLEAKPIKSPEDSEQQDIDDIANAANEKIGGSDERVTK